MRRHLSWLKPQPAEGLAPSVLALVAANLVPFYGVCFLHWQVFPVILLFWIENIVVGCFNVLKMLLASPGAPSGCVVKLFLVPFFWFHYGMFASVHGVFVLTLFGGTSQFAKPDAASLWHTIGRLQIGWAFLALVLSHGSSFVLNYVGKREYKTANLGDLMFQPYARVVVLTITIMAGGFVVILLGSPVVALFLLVVLKTLVDVQSHIHEHRGRAREGEPAQSSVRN